MQRMRGKVFGAVAAVAAAGLLAACGNNDSTATSTPTLTKTTSATSVAPTTTAGGDTGSGQPAPQSTQDAAPSDTSTSTPERPAPVPSQFITPPSGSPALSDKEKTYIDELKKAGLNPGSTDIAITAGNLVCQGKAENAPQDQIITYVTAIAGSDPSFDPSKMSVDQAGKIYYDVASKSYCNK